MNHLPHLQTDIPPPFHRIRPLPPQNLHRLPYSRGIIPLIFRMPFPQSRVKFRPTSRAGLRGINVRGCAGEPRLVLLLAGEKVNAGGRWRGRFEA